MSTRDVIVLKFGSSVLRNGADLPAVVDEIYRHMREAKRVLAVVSAFEGQTDRLLREAGMAFGEDAPEATAAYVATGESQSAALLTGALLQAGIAARTVDPREADLKIRGNSINAELESVNSGRLLEWFDRFSVLVLPGFFGIDPEGRIGLLGRGGSDYTALFLAQRLGAHCRLVKDVAGIYDVDPALAGSRAHRLSRVGWDAAAHIAGKLVQPKSMRFARAARLPFSVGALSAAEETSVGDYAATLAVPHEAAPPLNVALLGLGTVGGGVYARLAAQPLRFDVTRVVVNHPEKHQGSSAQAVLSADPWDAIDGSVDLVIDCMGGISPAAQIVAAALNSGRHVISANKAVLAQHWDEWAPYVGSEQPRLRFGAAVGGALPILELLATHAGRVQGIRGVINGTCNYILDSMRGGSSFESAVAGAQAAGFAEADPSRDISGQDAADKIELIARVAFGRAIPAGCLTVQGIDKQIEAEHTYLVASVESDGRSLQARVAPRKLAADDFLAGARAAENRIEVKLCDGRLLRLDGRGAGRWPTATAVCGDLLQVWREHCERHQNQVTLPCVAGELRSGG